MNNPFIKKLPIQLGHRVDLKSAETLGAWRAKVEEYYLQEFKDQLTSKRINISIKDDEDTLDRISERKLVDIVDYELQSMFNSKHQRKPIFDKNPKSIYSSANINQKVLDCNDFKTKIKQI